MGAGGHRLRKLQERAGDALETAALRRISGEPGEERADPGLDEMREQARPVVNILPGEEQEVFLQHALDIGVRKTFADGAAMFVIDDARGLVHIFPAALPGQVAEVGILHIKGREDFVEAA